MILIVDDDASVTASLALLLKQAGYGSQAASSPRAALELLEQSRFELVLQDMNFSRRTSGEEGLELLRRIKEQSPQLPVILITAWGSIELAVKGVRLGAADFVTKPWTNEQLLQSVRTALGLARIKRSPDLPAPTRPQLEELYDLGGTVGREPNFLRLLEVAGRVSDTDASVLITGESGTGKEVVADLIHRNSPRQRAPFVKVNLPGIPASLFESEMFGHVRGAFTDARQDRKGRFEAAHGGTIFLDEIGDLDFSSQAKLLRVLQDRVFEVLGSSVSRAVDVRVISATNRSLGELVERGAFREDLLYRLNLISLHLPALRERRGDIPILAQHFLEKTAEVYRRGPVSLDEEVRERLSAYHWPGNIRQLKQVIERAVLVSASDRLRADDLDFSMSMEVRERAAAPDLGRMTLDEMERAMILKALDEHAGNISRVAESLGLSRPALYRRFEKHKIKV